MKARRAQGGARVAALVASALAFAAPLAAEACPVCAGRTVDHPIAQAIILGSFILFPYAVVYTVLRFIRSGLRREDPASMATEPLVRPLDDDGDR